ncbi:MAG: hypothetical protein ACP5VE_05895 [Chthonomonadales bacterium]
MPSSKEMIAFKIGARARKMAAEECIVEGYEILEGAIRGAGAQGDAELEALLRAELEKYERRFLPQF